MASAQHERIEANQGRQGLKVTLTALGIVFGDVGTSPLYAMRECFGPHGVAPTHAHVMGVLSLIFWSLTLVISIKYLAFVMRADNRGGGGILALMALATSGAPRRTNTAIVLLGLFGAALLYGDGMITPAISVMSAVEGLGVAAPSLTRFVEPITVIILVALFLFQRRGTAGVGAIFGTVTLLWFVVIGALGALHIADEPQVLEALSPVHGALFLAETGPRGFLVLGAVFLVVTGAEALYADMGHFGKQPIRAGWFGVVFPALLLNYLGQGAVLLDDPSAAVNPFYRLAPPWAMYPLVALSTLATIIASQAIISGAFSLTRQATMLGYWPRIQIDNTSSEAIGQIYVPTINWLLMFAAIGLVVGFESSSNLAAAYGIAVTMTMVITTLLAYVVAHEVWGWRRITAALVSGVFLVPDLAFFGANAVKIEHGGWFPLLVAGVLFLLMSTWKRGRLLLFEQIRTRIVPLASFFDLMKRGEALRVPGAAVFMTSNSEGTPPALMYNYLHNHVVHEQVVLLTIRTEEVARIPDAERVTTEVLADGFVRVVAHYGFMEEPDVPALLARANTLSPPMKDTTFFLGRETLIAEGLHGMSRWRERLFALMARNAERAMSYFRLPPERVMEVGSQIRL